MNETKHILILGATGFIGSVFYEEIINYNPGNFHFHLLVRGSSNRISPSENTTVYSGEIEKFDWGKLNHTPDYVFHFARINSIRRSWGRKNASKIGKKANVKLIKFLEEKDKNIQLFYLSGSLMYGNSTSPITENHPLSPISFSKQYIKAEEPFLNHKQDKTRLKITMIRVPWVLGNGSWFQVFYKEYFVKNNAIPLYGNGDNIMSFIIREDIASCLIQLLKEEFYPVINISYPDTLSQKAFVELIANQIQVPIEKISLKNYENAVIEAFESNIPLSSTYQIFDSVLSEKSLAEKLKQELLLIFKDI